MDIHMNDEPLTYENLIDKFVAAFPEFKDEAEADRQWWYPEGEDEPLVYVFFGDVLNQFLVKSLRKQDNQSFLTQIFCFFETMANSLDHRVPEMLQVEILEYLGDDEIVLHRARHLMGKETLSLSYEAEHLLGRE
jgi:hypothetical protein